MYNQNNYAEMYDALISKRNRMQADLTMANANGDFAAISNISAHLNGVNDEINRLMQIAERSRHNPAVTHGHSPFQQPARTYHNNNYQFIEPARTEFVTIGTPSYGHGQSNSFTSIPIASDSTVGNRYANITPKEPEPIRSDNLFSSITTTSNEARTIKRYDKYYSYEFICADNIVITDETVGTTVEDGVTVELMRKKFTENNYPVKESDNELGDLSFVTLNEFVFVPKDKSDSPYDSDVKLECEDPLLTKIFNGLLTNAAGVSAIVSSYSSDRDDLIEELNSDDSYRENDTLIKSLFSFMDNIVKSMIDETTDKHKEVDLSKKEYSISGVHFTIKAYNYCESINFVANNHPEQELYIVNDESHRNMYRHLNKLLIDSKEICIGIKVPNGYKIDTYIVCKNLRKDLVLIKL